jgi:hypothetical protein
MERKSKLTLEEWRTRVNELTMLTWSRHVDSFQGIHWDYLHARGCKPMEVLGALIEELRAVKDSNDGLVNV